MKSKEQKKMVLTAPIQMNIPLRVVVLFALMGTSLFAASFTNRPTSSTYAYAVDAGMWIGNALLERREALGITTAVFPVHASQQSQLSSWKGSIADVSGSFVDPGQEIGGSFDSWFSSTANSALPVLSATQLVVRVGSPANYFSYTPWRPLDDYGWKFATNAMGALIWTSAYPYWWSGESVATQVVLCGGCDSIVEEIYLEPIPPSGEECQAPAGIPSAFDFGGSTLDADYELSGDTWGIQDAYDGLPASVRTSTTSHDQVRGYSLVIRRRGPHIDTLGVTVDTYGLNGDWSGDSCFIGAGGSAKFFSSVGPVTHSNFPEGDGDAAVEFYGGDWANSVSYIIKGNVLFPINVDPPSWVPGCFAGNGSFEFVDTGGHSTCYDELLQYLIDHGSGSDASDELHGRMVGGGPQGHRHSSGESVIKWDFSYK